ncbi:hypothetical protein C0992_008337, partial [Termitomyces sp. T32_za158]
RQWAEAAAQSAAIMSAEREAELLEERRVALAKLLAKCMAEAQAAGFLEAVEVGAISSGEAVWTGEAAEGDFLPPDVTLAQLRNLLVPCRDEVVLDANRRAGESMPGLKGKKTVSLTARRDFKLQKGSCDKCWANNDPEGCWYPTGAQPCYRCNALKRACTFSGRKFHERGKVDPHVQCNFEKAVLVWCAREFIVAQRTLVTAGGTTSLSAASLALSTAQELGIAVDVAAPQPATPKGKAKAVSSPRKRLASPSSDLQLAKQSRSGTASWKGAKVAPRQDETSPVAGPSRQIIPIDPVESVLCPGGVVLSELESPSGAEVQSDPEEAAESSDLSESPSEVSLVLLPAVQPNYAPLLTPSINRQEFLWLRKALDYPISALYIEAAREKAEGMAEVMRKDMQVAAAEMEGLQLCKKIMARSVDILERYQTDCVEALAWWEVNETHLRQPYATLFPLPPGASPDPWTIFGH